MNIIKQFLDLLKDKITEVLSIILQKYSCSEILRKAVYDNTNNLIKMYKYSFDNNLIKEIYVIEDGNIHWYEPSTGITYSKDIIFKTKKDALIWAISKLINNIDYNQEIIYENQTILNSIKKEPEKQQ